MMNKEIEKIFVKLIKESLSLPDNYGYDEQGNEIPCVVIKAQNVKLFNTEKLQITVGTINSNIYANRREYREVIVNNKVVYFEDLHINEKRTMQIDVYSKNNDARIRFPEVQACLVSTLAEQLQEQYHFRIGTISHAVNISGLDGGSDINRFTIRFDCLTWNTYSKSVDYYDTFRTQARNTNSNIFADFTIHNNQIIDNTQDNV